MSLDKLLAEGLIANLQSSYSTRAIPRPPERPIPRNATQKLLAQGLLTEEQMSPSPFSSRSRHHLRLSSTSTLVNNGMERPSSSSGKWYHSRRLSFSSKSKNKEPSRIPSPELLRQQAQSPQELFESQLGKHFDMKRLGGLQTIRRAPKQGL